jgi:selenocysteine-specific elongation factor
MVVVSEPELQPASVLDVQLKMLPDAPTIKAGATVRLLVGTAEVLAIAEPIGFDTLKAGQTQWVQLRTAKPIVALPHDRFIIRRESPMETLGGGRILDPWAPRAKRKHHADISATLQALAGGDNSVLLYRAGPAGMSPNQMKVRSLNAGVALGDRFLHTAHIESLAAHLCTGLTAWHTAHPLSPGAPRRALHTGPLAALTEGAFDALIARMTSEGTVETSGPTARLAGFSVILDSSQQAAHSKMLAGLSAAGLEGERFDLLITGLDGLVSLLIAQNHATRVGERVVCTTALHTLCAQVKAFFAKNDRLSPGDFKNLTGLSRRTAIPLLEWLDTEGLTRRDGDARIKG